MRRLPDGKLGILVTQAVFLTVLSALWSAVNYFSGQSTDRLPLYLPWEAEIPFVWAAVPIYLTLDLAVGISPFAFSGWRAALPLQLTLLVQLLIAIPGFLLLPLELGFTGDHPTGIWGDLARALDVPDFGSWNHIPSLHVSFAWAVAWFVGQSLKKPVRMMLYGWAGLVTVSTLLVHEHHLIDAAAGAILAVATLTTVAPWLRHRLSTDCVAM